MNPNDSPLDLRGINCDLKIDGLPFATGISGEQAEIPAYGTAIVPVTVYASVLEVITSMVQIIQERDNGGGAARSFSYELAGKIRLGGGFPRSSLPFTSKGEFNMGTNSGI